MENEILVRDYDFTDRQEHIWLGFTCDTDPDTARERFKEKFGYLPTAVVEVSNCLLVGPIGEYDNN